MSPRQRLFENLRMLPHAPGVQMQAIPEDAVQEDSGDEEEEDPNKRISSTNLLAFTYQKHEINGSINLNTKIHSGARALM